MNTLQPYPEYRDSGVPWLGDVPAHWNNQSLWTVSKLRDERGAQHLPLLSVFLDRGVIRYEDGGGQVHRPSLDLSSYQIVRVGDFVLNNQQAWRGSVGVSQHHGIISPAYIVLNLSQCLDAVYANFLMRSRAMVDQFVVASKGVGDIQRQIYWPYLKNVQVPLPPPSEQAAIVRFLEHIDRRVNRFVRAKRRLVALLNEQKQAIIHRAVTRGLDPDVRLKPSGVAWLGDVPEGWEVIRSRRLFSVRKELSRPDDVQLSATQAYGVIPQAKFEELVGRRVVKISMHLEKRRHVEKDDFVISMGSFQGGLERAWEQGAIRSSYIVLKPEANVDVNFFEYLFKSYGYIRALQATADFIRDGQDLTYSNFRMVDLPLLPLDEQRRIANFIARETANIDFTRIRLEREINLIREYRTRLVADVVTGKLDVRNVVLHDDLPEDDMPLIEDELTDDADSEITEENPNADD